jgi:hypothetical protein
MARRPSLLSGLAALGLMLAIGAPGPASAIELPTHRASAKPTVQGNFAPTRQKAVSTAISIGGPALASAANQSLTAQDNSALPVRRGPVLQFSRSPTVQTAVSAAISVGGPSATALAANNGSATQNATLGPSRPVPLQQLGRAPAVLTAVSTAVRIDGLPIPLTR